MTDPEGSNGRIDSGMRLRPSRAPVTRLSRKVLVGLGIVAAGAVSAALFFALAPHRGTTGSELYNLGSAPAPEGLASLPRDNTGLPRPVPKLGPPLPGDLGRPIVAAGAPAPPTASNPLAQEEEAALKSRLFVQTNYTRVLAPTAPAAPTAGAPSPAIAAATPRPKDRNLAFLDGPVDRRTVSPDRVEAPTSPYVLQAGSVIPAALITGIRSDLPGEVTAQVTDDVFDSPTGKIRLIPQGARLVGQYDAQVSFGQSRVLLVWTRLIMPSGRSIVSERQPAADSAGYAGLEDGVDNTGACCSRPQSCRPCSVSGRKPVRPATTRTHSCRRSARALRRASTRSASRWSDGRSPSSRP